VTIRFTTLPKFEMTLKEFSKKTEIALEDVIRKVAFDCFSGVVKRTPVDTGWARSSWNVAFVNPDTSVPDKPGDGAGEAAAIAKNNEQQSKLYGDLGIDKIVWITNSLDYVQYLEAGWSKQAGKGFMVERTLQDVVSELRNIVRGL